MKGIFRLTTFKDVSVVSGCGVGGGSLGYANTLYVPPEAVLRGPPVGGDAGLGDARSRPTTPRRSGCSASCENPHDDPADQLLRELGEELGVGDTYKHTPVGHLLRRAGQDRAGPVLRRRGPRPHRLQAVRSLHGRLRARGEEHARQELPVLRREARRARDARTHRRRRPPARRGRRQRRLRGRKRALGRLAAQGTTVQRARGVVVSAGPLGHEQAAAALPPGGLAAAHLRAPRRARAHQLGVDPDGHRARGLPGRPDQARRDHLLDLPRPEHAHRDRHLRRRRRLDARALHAADRRRHARDAAAEAARPDPAPPATPRAGAVRQALVAAHDHHPRDADARQRDRAAPPQRARSARSGCRPNRTPSAPTRRSSRSPTRPPNGSPSAPAGSPRARSPRRCSTSPRPPTSSAAQ